MGALFSHYLAENEMVQYFWQKPICHKGFFLWLLSYSSYFSYSYFFGTKPTHRKLTSKNFGEENAEFKTEKIITLRQLLYARNFERFDKLYASGGKTHD